MTATQKLKQLVLFKTFGEKFDTAEAVEAAYQRACDDEYEASDNSSDAIQEVQYELRYGTDKTGLPCESSRHFESKSVATMMLDGSWVGWTFWYGGGKHAEPESIEWMEDAYDVEMKEVQRVVREFSLPGGTN